jgi:hypothetical protein
VTSPKWPVVGAEVVVWCEVDGEKYHHVRAGHVYWVGPSSFTVVPGDDLHYAIDTCSAWQGYGRNAVTWWVVPAGSGRAAAAWAAQDNRRRADKAVWAVSDWIKARSRETRERAIQALQAIEMDREDMLIETEEAS